jgi:hypothetical protein
MEIHTEIPVLFEDDTVVVEMDPTDGGFTEMYNLPLRPPAPSLWSRFPITQGFLVGAPVEVIAYSLATGREWTVGPAPIARGAIVIWLSDPSIPFERQIAAWLVRIKAPQENVSDLSS